MVIIRRYFFAAMAIWLSACAAGGTASGAGGDRTRLSWEELERHGPRNLLDVIRRDRPHWLASRGPTTLGSQGEVSVYRDGSRLGGPAYLRDMPADVVESVQYLTGPEASSRYGLNHQHGAIVVTTKKR